MMELPGGVQLIGVAVPSFLEGPRIFYRPSRYEAGHYEYHRWVRPLSEAIAQEFQQYVRATGRLAWVGGPEESIVPGACRVRLQVLDLNEVDHENGEWTARVTLCVRLQSPDDRPAREYRIVEESRIQPRNPKGFVEAVNRSLDQVMVRIVDIIVDFIKASRRPGIS